MLARYWDSNSVHPSVWSVSDRTKEHTVDILYHMKGIITLVFCHQLRLVGDVPFHLKFAVKVTHPFEKRRIRPISAYNVSTIRASEKFLIITNRKSTMRFSTSYI